MILRTIVLFGLSLCPSFAANRVEFLSEDATHALEVRWRNDTNAELRVFSRSATGEKDLWTAPMKTSSMARYDLKASISNNGELAIIEPRDMFDGPALLFFRKGELVRAYAGGFIAGQLSDPGTRYEKDFLAKGHVSGLIGEFDNEADPKLFLYWVGVTDQWFAVDLRTGDIVKPSKEQVTAWNRVERQKCLKLLNDFWRKSGGKRQGNDSSIANSYKFIARRHVAEDEAWIKRLLAAEIGGGGYFGRSHGMGGPVFTGVTTLRLSGGSDLRNLGDMLLAHWQGRWEPGREDLGEWAYPGGAPYVYLSRLHATVELPRAPRTNDGALRIVLRPATVQPGMPVPEFAWQMKDAIEMMQYDFSHGTNRPVEPISNKIEVDLSALTPGIYSIETVWTRTRERPKTNVTILSGDYFETNRIVTLKAAENGTVAIQCTNRLAGREDLYAADLAGWTNIEQRVETHARTETKRGQTIAEQVLTNITLGPLTLRKLTYGTSHRYLSHEDNTAANALQLWFDHPKDFEPIMCRFEIRGSSGQQFEHPPSSAGYASGGAHDVGWITIDQWPRAEKNFWIRLISQEGRNLGEAWLPNIAQKNYAPLVPDRIPTSTNINGLTVTYKGVRNDGFSYVPLLELGEGTTVSKRWQTASHFFEDAAGNRGSTMEEFAHEKALRYEVQLFRSRAGVFSKDEKWVVPMRISAAGEFQELNATRKFGEVEIRLIAVAGIGETTYVGSKPVSATASVDPTARMYDPYVCRFVSPGKPDVFIRGTGREAYERMRIAQQKTEDRFSVIGVRPHLAVQITGLTAEHRVFLASEQLDERSLLGSSPNTENKRGDIWFFPLPARSGSDFELEIVVQKCARASFVVEVPGVARVRKSFEKFKLPFLGD
jgi:hypothetical protein